MIKVSPKVQNPKRYAMNLLCWSALSPQMIGTEFMPPPTWNVSKAQTPSRFGCDTENAIKSRLNRTDTLADRVRSIKKYKNVPNLTDGLLLLVESGVELHSQRAS